MPPHAFLHYLEPTNPSAYNRGNLSIVALPLHMFYNTGIATYIWVISNRKAEHRKGKVQLIDATQWFKALRKNLGKKNCELSDEDIQRICEKRRLGLL